MDGGQGDKAQRIALSPLLASNDFPPLSARVQVDFGARSRSPADRQSADHFLIVRLGRHQETLMTSLPREEVPLPFNEFGYGMVVADGAREVASRLAISALVHVALHFGKWNMRIDPAIASEVIERVDRFYRQVDGIVGAQRRRDTGSPDMSTTLTAIFSAGSDCFFAHVGHSRAYLLRHQQLTQLTRDHTIAVRASRSPAHELASRAHDLEHMLTDVIGGPSGEPAIDIEHFQLLDGDMVMLCTNGLTDVLSDEEIEEVLQHRVTPDEQCQLLTDLAIAAGTSDDVTVLVARYRIPPY